MAHKIDRRSPARLMAERARYRAIFLLLPYVTRWLWRLGKTMASVHPDFLLHGFASPPLATELVPPLKFLTWRVSFQKVQRRKDSRTCANTFNIRFPYLTVLFFPFSFLLSFVSSFSLMVPDKMSFVLFPGLHDHVEKARVLRTSSLCPPGHNTYNKTLCQCRFVWSFPFPFPFN